MEILYKPSSSERITDDKLDDLLNYPEAKFIQEDEQQNYFSEADFTFIVSNLINGVDIESSISKLYEKTTLDGFDSNTIDYQPKFIEKLSEILIVFLESENIAFSPSDDHEDSLNFSLLINTIKLLSNIWNISKTREILFSGALINPLISLIIKFNNVEDPAFQLQIRDFSIESINALNSLSSYFPELVSTYCNPEFFTILNKIIYKSNSYYLRKQSFKLLDAFCGNQNALYFQAEFFSTILPPILIDFFDVDFFETTTNSLFSILQYLGDIPLSISLSSEMIPKLITIFKYCDKTKLDGCFSIVSFCIDRINFLRHEVEENKLSLNEYQTIILEHEAEINDSFFCPSFADCLINSVRQLFSESEFQLFHLVDIMMDEMWRTFFDEGLIEMIVCEDGLIHFVQFHNKIHCASCITRFLEVASSYIEKEEIDEFCVKWGESSPDKNIGPIDDDDDEELLKREEEINQRSIIMKSLSNWKVCQCVVFGGGLSFLIVMISSIKDSNLLKRILYLIYHLISTGPPEFAQLAYNEGLLDNSDYVASEISESVERNDDDNDILAIISQISQFYQRDKSE